MGVPKCSKALSHVRGLSWVKGSTGPLGPSLLLGSCSVRGDGTWAAWWPGCWVRESLRPPCQKFGSTLSCQASGAANHAACHSTVMPKKLSCKVHNAQVFPRASHTVTRWHINISRFSHSLFHGVHNVFAFQLPLCHNHMWHVMFYFKICTSCLYLRILNRIFAQLQNICLLLLIDINCFTFYRALFKIIGSKAENKLFQSGMDDNNVLMVSVLLCENVTLKGWCSVPLPAQTAICTHLFWRLVLRL